MEIKLEHLAIKDITDKGLSSKFLGVIPPADEMLKHKILAVLKKAKVTNLDLQCLKINGKGEVSAEIYENGKRFVVSLGNK